MDSKVATHEQLDRAELAFWRANPKEMMYEQFRRDSDRALIFKDITTGLEVAIVPEQVQNNHVEFSDQCHGGSEVEISVRPAAVGRGINEKEAVFRLLNRVILSAEDGKKLLGVIVDRYPRPQCGW